MRASSSARAYAGPQAPYAAPPAAAPPAPGALESDAPSADPEAKNLFLASLSQPAAQLAVALAPPAVTAMALENTARGEAGGMTADVSVQTAILMEGQRATSSIVIAPGACMTFIAHGGLGVVEVDLFVTTGAGQALRVLAEDPTTGPIAVLGGRGACFRSSSPAPLSAELHARVRRGAGIVITRGYRR